MSIIATVYIYIVLVISAALKGLHLAPGSYQGNLVTLGLPSERVSDVLFEVDNQGQVKQFELKNKVLQLEMRHDVAGWSWSSRADVQGNTLKNSGKVEKADEPVLVLKKNDDDTYEGVVGKLMALAGKSYVLIKSKSGDDFQLINFTFWAINKDVPVKK